jgi:polyisoprenyl-teichoic acid--peptidoglycan teichoic acid transferase
MTDLKPISSGSKSGARNRGTTSDPNPAKLQLTPYVQSTAPAKPAQTNGAQTTVPNKPRPEKPKSDCSGAACTQSGCPGTIADGYCDVCGIPAAPTVAPAAPTKPTQPSATETAASNKPSSINAHAATATFKPKPAVTQSAASTKPAKTSTAQTAAPTKTSPAKDQPAAAAELPKTSAAQAADAAFRAARAAAEALSRPGPAVSQPASITKLPEPSAAKAATFTKSGTANPEAHAPTGAVQVRATPIPVVTTANAATAPLTARTEPDPSSTQAAGRSEPSPTGAQAPVLSQPTLAEADSAAKPVKRRRVLPIVLASVAATLVAVLALAALLINQVERSLTENLDREDLLPTDSNTAPHPTKEAGAGDALNFVVMGYDSRDPSIEHSGSLMILHLNAKRDQAYLITFPRDTWVSIPGRGNNKINAAYRFGGGPKLTVSTVEQLTATRIDHAVMVDFQGFARLTDAVGGVTVYNKTGFSTHGFDYPKGNITVSGERALYFVGERDSLPRGDFDRAANERNLVRAIIAKSLSAKTLSDPRRLFSVVSGGAEHLTVDKSLTKSKIRSTVLSLRLTDKDVHLMKAPVSGKATKNGQRVDVVDKAKLAELRTALRQDKVNDYLAKYPQG